MWGNKGGRRREGEGCAGRKEKGGGGEEGRRRCGEIKEAEGEKEKDVQGERRKGGGGEEEGMNNKEKQ